MRLLEGVLVDREVEDSVNETVERLEDDNRRLRVELAESKAATNRALSALRKQLAPLYRALQSVFGELDAVGVEDSAASSAAPRDGRTAAVWESWKSRLGGSPAKVIDALLLHSDLSGPQICIATGIPKGSISQVIYKLNKAGLIVKRDGRYSLKQL